MLPPRHLIFFSVCFFFLIIFPLFFYLDLLRHAKCGVVVDPVHLLTDSYRDVIGLPFLQAADGVGGVVGTEHDFRLRAGHVLPLAILKDIAVSAGGLVILDGHLAGRRVLYRAEDHRL